jgi:hypothetical protein
MLSFFAFALLLLPYYVLTHSIIPDLVIIIERGWRLGVPE